MTKKYKTHKKTSKKNHKKGAGLRYSGEGFLENTNKFLKDSKLISNVGSVVLPLATGALGTAISVNPVSGLVGAAAGKSVNEFIKSQGYGKGKKPGLKKRTQFATGVIKKRNCRKKCGKGLRMSGAGISQRTTFDV